MTPALPHVGIAPAARPPVPATPAPPDPARTLLGPDGEPINVGGEGWVAPHAFNFAAVLNTVAKAYSYRWDEALKDSPANALAMKRDAYYLSLLQERTAPTANLNWEIKVDKRFGGKGEWVKERLKAAVEAVPDLTGMLLNQLEALWYGRYGSQVVPGRAAGGVWTVKEHVPVNGDSIQYSWDRTPIVLVNQKTAHQYADDRGTIVVLDRGGWGLKLDRPEWRERFVIHHHVADAADYFQGEMAGGVHGVGLRSRVYWSGWMKTETLSWMLSFMQGVGMMDLIIFNYPSGNPEAKRVAEDNAKKITNGLALLVARGPDERGFPAVEQVSLNHNGVQVLQDLIANYFDRHIERLFVGQSMSSGADDGSGLGGTGRANFAQDTKFQLLKMDAKRLGETLTRDLLGWMKRKNCPGAEDIPARFEFATPDPSAEGKLKNVSMFLDKMKFKQDEVYELIGMTAPGPHDETVGGQPAGGMPGMGGPPAPGGAPGQPGELPGRAATDGGQNDAPEMPDDSELPPDLLAGDGWPETYGQQDQWTPHTIQAGPRKGQTAYINERTGELRDAPPGGQPAAAAPNAVQRGVAKVQGAARAVGARVSEGVDKVPGGKVLKALGKGAVRVFHAVEKPLMAAMANTQMLARQAAYERGMSDAHVDVLGKVLALADFAGGYAGAAAGYAAAGAVGGKVGSFMPTASVAYLAYSTARDPLATWRAAKRLVRAKLAQAGRAATRIGGVVARGADAAAGGLDRAAEVTQRALAPSGFGGDDVPEFYALSPDVAGRMADSLKGAHSGDWWQACCMAAMGDTRDPERALSLASELADQKPVPDGAELGAAMVHLATMGNWQGVDALADLLDSAPDGEGEGTPDEKQPERYAAKRAEWTQFQHKSGRTAWRSAGGLVRFSPPKEQPVGPPSPGKRALDQRARAEAWPKAAAVANRIAQGHAPGVDELAALPDQLKALTSAQLLALNKAVGANGGKLKADRIAGFVAKVNQSLAGTPPAARPPDSQAPPPAPATPPAPASQPGTSPAARPPNGLRFLTPEERTPNGNEVTTALTAALDKATHLSPERRKVYAGYITDATARMPQGAVDLIGDALKDAQFFRRPRDIAQALTAATGDQKYAAYGDAVKGAFRNNTGVAYLDGDGGAGTYAHELAHAIDHHRRFSNSPEWQEAFKGEIDRPDAPLSYYATTSPSEGFAEFARLVYTGDLKVAESKFPKATALFKRHQLWPASPPSKTSSPTPSTTPRPTSTSTSTTPPAPLPSPAKPASPPPAKAAPTSPPARPQPAPTTASNVVDRWRKFFGKLIGRPEGMQGGEVVELVPAPEGYDQQRAPEGGVTVGGKEYTGGQFIPADVVATATADERKAIKGGGNSPGRAATRIAGKPKVSQADRPKAVRAVARYKDVARRRRVAHAVRNEGELSQAIGAFNLPDSEPADVVVMYGANGDKLTSHRAIKDGLARREAAVLTLRTGKMHASTGGSVVRSGKDADDHALAFARKVLEEPAQFVEVKTLLKSPKDSVSINAAAKRRKERWVRKYGVSFSVVVLDDRKGQKNSGHRVYVLPHGWHQTVRLDQTEKAESLEQVLDKIDAGAETGRVVAELIALRKRA